MAVRIVIDDFGLFSADGMEDVSSPDVSRLQAVRERIRQRLRAPGAEPFVVRMTSAIFRRFEDLTGQPGLTVEEVSPRRALRERLEGPPPRWLSDELAAGLGLLQAKPSPCASATDAIDRVLGLMDPDLVDCADAGALLGALSRQPAALGALLKVAEVKERLQERFRGVGIAEGAEVLAHFTDHRSAPVDGYRTLALAAVRETLDSLCVRDGLAPDFALPPRLCSRALLAQLPLLPIAEQDADRYPELLCHLASLAERRIHAKELPAESLVDYLFQDWPAVIERFQELFEQSPGIASEPLALALDRLSSPLASGLAERMREYLDFARCDPLPRESSVQDVLRWSERYFRYAIGAFEREAEPDEEVGASFARWVAAERSRIMQSEYDWREAARAVERGLAAGNVVVFCILDALSAIHQDMVELELRERLHDQESLLAKPLFAPLPTITEVGKIAILTGNETPTADYERALRERFAAHLGEPDALQIVKSWQHFGEKLKPRTRLLVCFDNRIDDDLHSCTDFRYHRERVRTVAKQLSETISKWQLDAARLGRQATILMTADHGATKVSRSLPPLPGTTAVERRILEAPKMPQPLPEGFSWVPKSAGEGGYVVPHGRLAFGSHATLLHGGLTPEEVLIPLIAVARDVARSSALSLEPAERRCSAAANGWFAVLRLANSTNDSFFNLKVLACHPFSGESQPIPRLGPYETQPEIVVKIASSIAQRGNTRVGFELRYQPGRGDAYERLACDLDLDLAEHLMERTAAAERFDDIFDM